MELSLKNNQKLVAYIVAIVAIMAFCIYLVTLDINNIAFLVLAITACWPMAKFVWERIKAYQANPIRLLKRNLPKAGFSIEQSRWEENGTRIDFVGKFYEDSFVFRAYKHFKSTEIYYMTFAEIAKTDPKIPKLLEAINETNSSYANHCIVLGDPDEEGMRKVFSLSRTVLPTYNTVGYLDYIMKVMHNSSIDLHENFHKKLARRDETKRPVGFNVAPTLDEKEPSETHAPAAKENSSIN